MTNKQAGLPSAPVAQQNLPTSTQQYLQDVYDNHNLIQTVNQNPEGVRYGRYGDMVRYFDGTNYTIYTCISSPNGKHWITTNAPLASNAVQWGNITGTITDQIDLVLLIETTAPNNPNGNIICDAYTPIRSEDAVTLLNGWEVHGVAEGDYPQIYFKFVKTDSFDTLTVYYYGITAPGDYSAYITINGVTTDTTITTLLGWRTSTPIDVSGLTNGTMYDAVVGWHYPDNTNYDLKLFEVVIIGS